MDIDIREEVDQWVAHERLTKVFLGCLNKTTGVFRMGRFVHPDPVSDPVFVSRIMMALERAVLADDTKKEKL
jgi:hypothetical protein